MTRTKMLGSGRKSATRNTAIRSADLGEPPSSADAKSTARPVGAHGAGLRPFIVGIGASAGGLEALEAFFDTMPSDSGMIFVVVTHQHPQHASLLPELLARRTRMPVARATDQVSLESNHVYVSSPGQNLALLHGAVQIMEVTPGRAAPLPIDYFFRSLALDQEEQAICVVLSGTGTDGTLGLRAIKGHGGMAVVQDGVSALYKGMPESAQATQLVDFVMAPKQMPAQLLRYTHAAQSLGPGADALEAELKNTLPKIFVLIRNHIGHDFSGYKPGTMERRIERRMRVHHLIHANDYVRLLQNEPHEIELLFRELLITVTQFFRDPRAFDALAAALHTYIEGRPERSSLRIWVPGCSTGEEAYSIAMLALELSERAHKHLHLQIFATDLDSQAIDVARAGLYPDGVAADVGAARLERFFVAEGNGYRIHKHVRDCVVFAPQNLLEDPPFTKLDLVSCRNLMIYLTSELQQPLFSLFHYALNPGGMLWLGTSETAAAHSDMFVATHRKEKLYTRREVATPGVPMFDLRQMRRRGRVSSIDGAGPPRPQVGSATTGIAHGVEQVLIERFAPATLIVSERGEIAYIHGRTGAFLEPSVGQPRHDLFAMAREGLRPSLQSALRTAALEDREAVYRGVSVKTNAGVEQVTVIARRIAEPESLRGLFRVSFAIKRPAPQPKSKAVRAPRGDTRTGSDDELATLRESLRATHDELQTSNEELRSANEELQSTNEELQSTNEELETSKEEMQALNEELHTLNSELQSKIDDFVQVNDDLQNLLNGTDIATLFLDPQLRIKRYTERARRVIRLISSDIGRPIADLTAQVRYPSLTADAQAVLDSLQPHETEVQGLDGHWHLVRILPYRTGQNLIAGVVITFVDIDKVKRAELLAAASVLAERVVLTVREPLLVLDDELRIVSSNPAFSRLTALELGDIQGKSLSEITGGALDQPRLRELLEAVLREGRPIEAFTFTLTSAGVPRRLCLSARRLEEVGAKAAPIPLVLAAVSAEPNGSQRSL